MLSHITKSAALATLFVALTCGASAQSFNDVIGRNLTNDQGTIQINSNGTLTGSLAGNTLSGRWWVEEGRFCREGNLGPRVIERACQTVRIRGNRISFFSEAGERTSQYTIE